MKRVCILKLVDKHVGEAGGEGPSDIVVIAQKIARREDQIVEIELRAGTLVIPVALEDWFGF